jgi:hypothetical protein
MRWNREAPPRFPRRTRLPRFFARHRTRTSIYHERNPVHHIMAPTNDAEKEEKLKAALWYSVGQTIDSVSLSKDINATPHFIGALSEMLWAQVGSNL